MDGNWLTSRAPQDIAPFVEALIDHFAVREPRRTASSAHASEKTSAPQRSAPPALVLDLMKWLPRPSLRTAAVIGAGLALLALGSSRRRAPLLERRGAAVGLE